jgi:hypothetical protein
VSMSLHEFLIKYQDILGDASPEEYIIPGRTGASLTNVLVSFSEMALTAALTATIGSRSPKWLYRFRWRRRVRCPGQHLFDSRLERPRVFAGE